MNIKLLERIAVKIVQEHPQFAMRMWFTDYLVQLEDKFHRRLINRKIPNCGTAACIGGWACCLTEGVNPKEGKQKKGSVLNILQLTSPQYFRLCFFANWPAQFRKHKIEGTKVFAKQAAKRIKHFIATNGEE